jgi:hypothetical protein
MIYIKKFNDKVNEEFEEPLKDVMLPRVDQLIEYLQDYKQKLESSEDEAYSFEDETEKVDKMWQDVFYPVPNDINSKRSSFNK